MYIPGLFCTTTHSEFLILWSNILIFIVVVVGLSHFDDSYFVELMCKWLWKKREIMQNKIVEKTKQKRLRDNNANEKASDCGVCLWITFIFLFYFFFECFCEHNTHTHTHHYCSSRCLLSQLTTVTSCLQHLRFHLLILTYASKE